MMGYVGTYNSLFASHTKSIAIFYQFRPMVYNYIHTIRFNSISIPFAINIEQLTLVEFDILEYVASLFL